MTSSRRYLQAIAAGLTALSVIGVVLTVPARAQTNCFSSGSNSCRKPTYVIPCSGIDCTKGTGGADKCQTGESIESHKAQLLGHTIWYYCYSVQGYMSCYENRIQCQQFIFYKDTNCMASCSPVTGPLNPCGADAFSATCP